MSNQKLESQRREEQQFKNVVLFKDNLNVAVHTDACLLDFIIYTCIRITPKAEILLFGVVNVSGAMKIGLLSGGINWGSDSALVVSP